MLKRIPVFLVERRLYPQLRVTSDLRIGFPSGISDINREFVMRWRLGDPFALRRSFAEGPAREDVRLRLQVETDYGRSTASYEGAKATSGFPSPTK